MKLVSIEFHTTQLTPGKSAGIIHGKTTFAAPDYQVETDGAWVLITDTKTGDRAVYPHTAVKHGDPGKATTQPAQQPQQQQKGNRK